MKMTTRDSPPRTNLREFLELIIMWHCSGDIPMDRAATSTFIESDGFPDFVMSVHWWCRELGLVEPKTSEIVRDLHLLYVNT